MARVTWKGFLSISLVTIPIKVYPATESSGSIAFHQLHNDCQTRMQQKKWCPHCDREVPSAEIARGYEFEKGRYVLLLEDELDAVQPPSTRVIDLVQFGRAAALPLRTIDRAYFLAPDGPDGGPAAEAYALLVEAMTGLVGIGTLAIYGREYLVAVGPEQGTLLLYTLHHAAELRPSPHVVAPAALLTLGAGEVSLARRVIHALKKPLTLDHYTDAYRAGVQQLIDAKIAGEEIVVPTVETPQVTSLREALTASLAAVKASPEKLPMAKATRTRKRA
jgi:DNA end-binding protein Ku